jgi:DNA-binding NarL/FixJ family response regulator
VRDRARAGRRPGETATERELAVVAAVLATGSEKAAAHRLGLSHSTVKHHLASARLKVGATTTAQLVWILGPRLPAQDDRASTDARRRPLG